MLEQLLKNINEIIKKNEKILQENPELFEAIKERFYKAIDDEEDQYGSSYDPYSDLFDERDQEDQDQQDEQSDEEDPSYDYEQDPYSETDDEEQASSEEPSYDPFSEDEDTMQERILAQLEQKRNQKQQAPQKAKPSQGDEDMYSGAESDIKTPDQYKQQQQQSKEDQVKKRPTWQPKEKYAENHSSAIKDYMGQGYSHREAEALADAHDKLSMDQILKRGMKPSDPSPRMLEMLKPFIGEIYGEKKSQMSMNLDPSQNPDLHLNANKNAIIKQANLPYKDAALAYRKSMLDQGKTDDEIDDMMPAFKKKWHSENEQHIQGVHAAANKVSQLANQNTEARKQRVQDVKHSLILATKDGGEQQSPIVGDTSNIAGGSSNKEAIRQAAGGVKGAEDEPTQIGSSVDPTYRMATRNPDYVKQLEQKVVEKLAPDQMDRYHAIKGIKKGGQ